MTSGRPPGPSGRPWRRPSGVGDEAGTRIGSALDAYLTGQGMAHASALSAVAACWREAVGDDVAAHSAPRTLRNGELVVTVDHSAWATELSFLANTVRERLNDQLGEALVTSLKVRVEPRSRLD